MKITGVALAVLALSAPALPCLAGQARPALDMSLGRHMFAPTAFNAYCARTADCLDFRAHTAADRLLHSLDAPDRIFSDTVESVESGAPARRVSLPWAGDFAQTPAERDVPTSGIANAYSASRWSLAFGRARGSAASSERTSEMAATPPVRITLDRAVNARLQQVNRRVNIQITPEADMGVFHEIDVWGASTGVDGRLYGDCEDYVLLKRRELIDGGFPAQALSIAVARTPRGELHAVLIVATDRGDLVLDNLSYWIRPWNDVPYLWIMRQVNGAADDWRAIVSDT